jgi:hypothetical protein
MKKTALDYLYEEIIKSDITPSDKNELLIFRDDLIKLIKIAKEIEKNQIIETFWIGVNAEAGDDKYMNGEDYYVKTFK